MNVTAVNNSSFNGTRPAYRMDSDKNNVIVGGTAAGGAVTAVTRGRRALMSVSSVSKKTTALAKSFPENTSKYKKAFLKLFETTQNSKVIKPFTKLAKTVVVKKIAGIVGAISALGVAATSIANTINTGVKLAKKID